jgi:hypothetical protein
MELTAVVERRKDNFGHIVGLQWIWMNNGARQEVLPASV